MNEYFQQTYTLSAPWLLSLVVCIMSAALALGYLIAKSRWQRRSEQEMSRVLSEMGFLTERLRIQSLAVEDLDTRVADRDGQIEILREKLLLETSLRSQAQERSLQIPRLEQELQAQKDRVRSLEQESSKLSAEVASLKTKLENEQQASEAKLSLLNRAEEQLSNAFKALSGEALRHANISFLELAQQNLAQFQEKAKGDLSERKKEIDHLVKPLGESLEKVNAEIKKLEEIRSKAYGGLHEQLREQHQALAKLSQETSHLVHALKSPTARGSWGEMQLKRIVELSGMTNYCDFSSQETTQTDDTGKLRPDMVVKMPGGRQIVIDSKAPLKAYLEAVESVDPETRRARLIRHAALVRHHITQLGSKDYWSRLDNSPEFVVLFLPGEAFFSAALEVDPSLIEFGVEKKVILATPTTLIALLKAVAYGWNHVQLAEHAQAISELGKSLHERIASLAEHFVDLRRSLEKSVESYNKAVGTIERRVLVSARRFKDLGSGSKKEIPILELIEESPKKSHILEEEVSEIAAGG